MCRYEVYIYTKYLYENKCGLTKCDLESNKSIDLKTNVTDNDYVNILFYK